MVFDQGFGFREAGFKVVIFGLRGSRVLAV
jgi:hypothetical protein